MPNRVTEAKERQAQNQLVLVDELLVESVKEALQAHLSEIGLSTEGVESLRVKSLGKTTSEGIKIGLPAGLEEKDYVVLDTFLNALQRNGGNGYDGFKVGVSEGDGLKNNAILTAPGADQLVDRINQNILPAYHISMDGIRQMRASVICSNNDNFWDALEIFVDSASRANPEPKSAKKTDKPVSKPKEYVPTPYQQRVMSRMFGRNETPEPDKVPQKNAATLVAKQLRQEFLERMKGEFPREEPALVAKVVDENYMFMPVDDMGVLKVRIERNRIGVSKHYDIMGKDAEGSIWARMLPVMNTLIYDLTETRNRPERGTFRQEYLKNEPFNEVTMRANSAQDLISGINVDLRPELQIDATPFLGRQKG